MIKARNKKLSLVLVLAMLMTMFAGLGVANAVTGYSSSHQPLVATDEGGQNLGAVIVTFDNFPAAKADTGFILKLPDEFKLSAGSLGGTPLGGNNYEITSSVISPKLADAPGLAVYASYDVGSNKAGIQVVNAGAVIPELKFGISLNNVFVPASAEATINAKIMAQPNSVFGDSLGIPVGQTASGSVVAIAGDPVTISAGGIVKGQTVIYLRENKAMALKEGSKSFTLKLPAGFEWKTYALMQDSTTPASAAEWSVVATDSRTLEYSRVKQTPATGARIWTFVATAIDVDESVAKFGDVTVTIGGASNVNPSSVVIGTYADYGVKVTAADPETKVIAGRDEQYVSDIKIAELLGDSLLPNRTVYIELPDGLRWEAPKNFSWDGEGGIEGPKFASGAENGYSYSVPTNTPEVLKIVMNGKDTNKNKGAIIIERAMVEVAGNFTGDIKAKIWGNAGVNEEIILGKVIAPISATAEVKDVKIGMQKQAAGKITITEVEAEAILSSQYKAAVDNSTTGRVYLGAAAGTPDGWTTIINENITKADSLDTYLTVSLPFNVTWSNVPTVKVVEGDIQLGTVTTNVNGLAIPILTSSSVASKIEITDVNYTLDRTVPEGDMKATFAGNAVVQTNFVNRNYVVKEVVANCVTPAPGETIGSGEFRIGSNIYYAGGVAKVMDVAPYIKDSRTYVPMRYLGEILGAEVVWDDAARTVTLTKADTTVVFTIGSTSYTVNGEAKTADVAPEITNSRTMLPARFVAEAFGAVVGWDAATQTVLIQK